MDDNLKYLELHFPLSAILDDISILDNIIELSSHSYKTELLGMEILEIERIMTTSGKFNILLIQPKHNENRKIINYKGIIELKSDILLYCEFNSKGICIKTIPITTFQP